MPRTYEESLDLARKDTEYADEKLTGVTGEGESRFLNFASSGLLFRPDDHGKLRADLHMPKAGDTVRLFGRGFGYPVRGCALLRPRSLVYVLYWYETADEMREKHRVEVIDRTRKRAEEWEAKKEETAARVAALPAEFRTRWEFFTRRPEWGAEFGGYELFCCEQAVAFAKKLETKERVLEFAGAKSARQREMVPDISDGHSGNTFHASCKLAFTYLDKPEFLPKVHGALCPLVGCKAYGCYAAEPEPS